jgi:hypothetical protein
MTKNGIGDALSAAPVHGSKPPKMRAAPVFALRPAAARGRGFCHRLESDINAGGWWARLGLNQ